jgi:hypothetical protein
MKYNEKISDYNSNDQYSKDMQRIGNVVFNKKKGNQDDQRAWLRLKEYIKRLEAQISDSTRFDE